MEANRDDGDMIDLGGEEEPPRIATAASELDTLCAHEFSHLSSSLNGGIQQPPARSNGFPSATLPILLLFAGNHCCVDCGDEERGNLKYGSVGYGTVLCEVCAERHMSYTSEESNIQHLTTSSWSLRSILSLLSGGNSQMLEYIRSKPRWRPKGILTDPEEVLAFKQIYLSKAAATYRGMISQWVDDTYKERMNMVQAKLVSKERLLGMNRIRPLDPFENIFQRNNVSREDIPGFANSIGRNSSGLGDSFTVVGGTGGNTRNPAAAVLPPSFFPQENVPIDDIIDDIKSKIAARRNRNPSIRALSQQLGENDVLKGYPMNASATRPNFAPSRRTSDIVGEVKEFSIQDQEEPSLQNQWNNQNHVDEVVSLSGYGTNTLPRYRNDDVTSVGVRTRGFDDVTLGSMPLMNAGVPITTYMKSSVGYGKPGNS